MSRTAAVVLGVIISLVIGAVAYIYVRHQRNHGLGDADAGPLWRGGVTFLMENLDSQGFPAVRHKRLHFPMMGLRHRGAGRMAVTHAGLHWSAGLWWTLGQNCARGSFQLPWDEIISVTLTEKPATISAMGGYMLIFHRHGHRLKGEYLGDPGTLRQALDAGQHLAEGGA